MVNISVILDGNPKHYIVTDTGAIAGQIVVDTKNDADLFTVRFNGRSICSWTEEEGYGEPRTIVTKSSKIDIIDRTMSLVTAETGFLGSRIRSGRTIYPFTFIFNHNLPSTLKTDHGTIDYSINVILKPKGRRSAIILKKPIKLVSQPRDIHCFASYRPRAESKLATEKLCCVPIGTASATVTLQKAHLRLGESCLVILNVNNNLGSSLTPKVKLKRQTTYHANDGTTDRVNEDVISVLGEPIPGETVHCQICITLFINKDVVAPPFRTGNIDSTYFIVVKLLGGPKLRFMFLDEYVRQHHAMRPVYDFTPYHL